MIRKDRIGDAALQLFSEKGFRGVRMDDLAEYLGISKKTLYNHFPSKDALLIFALEQKVDNILSMLEGFFEDSQKDFLSRLEEVLSSASSALSFTDAFSRDQDLPRDLVNHVFPRLHDHILALVKKHVDEGIREGYIRTDIPAETLPYIHIGIIETFLHMESRYGVKTSVDDMLTFIKTIVFSGLLTTKGRQSQKEEP